MTYVNGQHVLHANFKQKKMRLSWFANTVLLIDYLREQSTNPYMRLIVSIK